MTNDNAVRLVLLGLTVGGGLLLGWLWQALCRSERRCLALEAAAEMKPTPQGWSVKAPEPSKWTTIESRQWTTPMGSYTYDEVLNHICGPATAGEGE